ncbi:TauD/TfdA family dioxygenase [Streptomyces filamentosus]|uniref:TauD/TfdA family dioxygenase n=2 Tax=Streptomyces filamentosus TaxID=67294 RepID=A0ABY4UW92_STRFL|nr:MULTISPECIES: TauD/TfdA family dioxygenase [Streptomyces]EFE75792.1 FrbJ [Streptomyces filamentosus NRRL 15998]EWS92810.1 FrbJ protein [Streptomyces filamentosus NRRL 11379]MYR79836.1 FrbJ [Streptomyces sp. SID5466]USC48616.1 TauD/TfdA family dioxygenase [Streptomyces filamentosus]
MTHILKEPVTGPSAWRRADVEDSSQWTYILDEKMRKEILESAEKIAANGDDVWSLSRTSVPLSRSADLFARCVDELENGRGLAMVRGVPIEGLSLEEAHTVFGVVGLHLGKAVPQNGRGDRVVSIKDHGIGRLNSKTVRGYQTNEALPFHSDAPDIAALLCLQQAQQGGEFYVASAMQIYNTLLEEAPELLGLYYAGIFYDYRGEEPPGEPPAYKNAIFGYHNNQLTCRYFLRQFADSAPAKLGFFQSEAEKLALDTFEEIAAREENYVSMRLAPGDMQLVDDNITVHRRAAYSDEADGATDTTRHLLRLWINVENGREFPQFVSTHRWGMKRAATVQQKD